MAGPQRKFIGVLFECCSVYNRIYVNKTGKAYEGQCPKCFKKVKVKIDKGGTSTRFFSAN